MSFARNLDETDEQLRARLKEKAKPRFGRMSKDFGELGELRRQKKAPRTEVLYIWVNVASQGDAWLLRSINNCSNDDLTNAIRKAGELLSLHKVSQADAEQALDLMYLELGKRTRCAI